MTTNPPRTVVISGASTGLGRATAREFATLGWRVAIGARRHANLVDAAAAVEASGGEVLARELDVTDDASIDAFFDATEAAFGVADVVVNNAAVNRPLPLHHLDPDQIRREVATSLTGSLLMTRRALRPMVDGGVEGDIVFVTSESGVTPWTRHVPYAAAKAGIEHACRCLRLELEGTGIRSHIVRVGTLTSTAIAEEWGPGELGAAVEEWRRLGLLRSPAAVDPHLVARAIVETTTTDRCAVCETTAILAHPARQLASAS